MMHPSPGWLLPFFALLNLVFGNTEKAIFLGPSPASTPAPLGLSRLTPENATTRTHLLSEFPSASAPHGKSTWLLLDNLVPGQRYELRVCWAATQPTAFTVNTYELLDVFENPDLVLGIPEISWPRQAAADKHGSSAGPESSALLVQIFAAADYYTTVQSMMAQVPPVHVDIILDPFVLNVLPRSLIPTVGYIAAIVFISWLVARRISARVIDVASGEASQKKKEQ